MVEIRVIGFHHIGALIHLDLEEFRFKLGRRTDCDTEGKHTVIGLGHLHAPADCGSSPIFRKTLGIDGCHKIRRVHNRFFPDAITVRLLTVVDGPRRYQFKV